MTDFDAELNVSNVGMQESSSPNEAAPGTARGIVGDVPGGLPPAGTSAIGGLLSSEPRSPRVASPAHIRVAQGVMRSFLITKVNPSYPPEAERQQVETTVLIKFVISSGNAYSVIAFASSNPRSWR
jgi:hypothetical protein